MKQRTPGHAQNRSRPRGRVAAGLGCAGISGDAELTERVCCGMDLDPRYVDVAVQRRQTLTGEQARQDAGGRSFEGGWGASGECGDHPSRAGPNRPGAGALRSGESGVRVSTWPRAGRCTLTC
jgi:hypothetical protein